MSNENIPEVTVAPKTNEKCPLDSASMSTSGLSLSPGTMDILSKIPEFHREILLKRWKEDEEAGVLTECFGKGMFDDSDDSKYIFWCGSEDSDGHFFCGGYFDDSNYEFLSSNSSTSGNQLGNELFLETPCNPHIFSLFKLECRRLS